MGNRASSSTSKERSYTSAVGLLNRPRTVQIIGLDNAGKTSILSWMDQSISDAIAKNSTGGLTHYRILPTIGLSQSHFQKFAIAWTVWDMSGHGRYRELWPYYYSSLHGLVFVVDALDLSRIAVARDELMGALKHPEISKSDESNEKAGKAAHNNNDDSDQDGDESSKLSSNASQNAVEELTPKLLESILPMEHLQGRQVYKIQPCSGLTGAGINEGFRWLADNIRKPQVLNHLAAAS